MAGSQLVLPTSNRAGDTATSQAVQTAIASSLLALGPYGQPRRMTVGANKTIKHRVVRALEDVDTIKPDKIAMEIVSRERRLPHVRRSTSNFWGFLGYYCSIKGHSCLSFVSVHPLSAGDIRCANGSVHRGTSPRHLVACKLPPRYKIWVGLPTTSAPAFYLRTLSLLFPDRPYLQMFRLSQRCMLVVDCDNTAIVSATTRASHPECFKKNLLS